VIDLHCHILPGIDDGPPDMAAALALARALVAAGTHTVAATPHVDEHFGLDPRDFPARVEEVRVALAAEGIPLEVVAGGEIALSRLPDLDDDDLRAVALGGGPYVLLECPLANAAPMLESAVELLLQRGHGVLLAHPERSPAIQREPDRLAQMIEAGALSQLTAGALAGDFGQTVRHVAVHLLRWELVHCVASDAHDATRRGPEMLAGIRGAERDVPGLEDRAAWLTEDVPAAILAGDDPPEPPPLGPPRRGWLSRLRGA